MRDAAMRGVRSPDFSKFWPSNHSSSLNTGRQAARLAPLPAIACFRSPFCHFPMSLTPEDIRRLAQLARLDLEHADAVRTLSQLNGIFSLVEQLQAVDTIGIEPLSHPLATIQAMSLRLRTDQVTETDQREANMANAPQQEDGLFLVPKVIE